MMIIIKASLVVVFKQLNLSSTATSGTEKVVAVVCREVQTRVNIWSVRQMKASGGSRGGARAPAPLNFRPN